jgi:hypothetical protein
VFHIIQKKAARYASKTKLMACFIRLVADELSAVKSLVANCTVRL